MAKDQVQAFLNENDFVILYCGDSRTDSFKLF